MLKIFIISLSFIIVSCAGTKEVPSKADLLVKELRSKTISKNSDFLGIHKLYKRALPFMGSKGDLKVNIEVIKLYARTLDHQKYLEHIETIYPAIEKEPAYFKALIKKEISDKEKKKLILENIKDYAAFIIRGNG